ncbi:MAG: DUF3604 domain-containing protein [Luminiphilus sp.]|nr:DUF3604 domain-containing protein [Luminiphilus sp.]
MWTLPASRFPQCNAGQSHERPARVTLAQDKHRWRRFFTAIRSCTAPRVGVARACLIVTALLNTIPSSATCDTQSPTRIALFGDLHVHTGLSFDAYISSIRLGPDDAYRYAKGEPLQLPGADGKPGNTARIDRPLDFAAVTDHSEFLGQVRVCTAESGLARWWPLCAMSRADNIWMQLLAASWWTSLGGQATDAPEPSFACTLGDCEQTQLDTWRDIQQAADDHQDTTADCGFTTFNAYEYTQASAQNNMHRNVIFRDERVTVRPISIYETGQSVSALWQALDQQCLSRSDGCDVLAIPHNSNLAGGLMFPDPASPQEASLRLSLEPVAEIIQHKGASECRFDRLVGQGVLTQDELCDFEQIDSDNLHMLGSVNGVMRSDRGQAIAIGQFAPRNLLRNVLKDGLALETTTGINPFRFGFIGSTDTHSATAGAAQERNYEGHLGRRDAQYRNVQDHFAANPGGLAVVWAEENTRDAIFDAIKRRETYATSGTRPQLRFFAGNYSRDICAQPDMLETAYQNGVPMGGKLTPTGSENPLFLIAAQQDPGTIRQPGNAIERVQIVKGWVDAEGTAQERVIDVLGAAHSGLGVDLLTCQPTSQGLSTACTVWEDANYQPEQNAFYYTRLIETPSCRWSTLQCQAAGVNPFSADCPAQKDHANALAEEAGATGPVYDNCCRLASEESFYSPVIRERAWSSPIWIAAPR